MKVEFKFPPEKMRALRLFAKQKGLSIEDELVQATEALYQKHVPGSVKAFLSSKEEVREVQPDPSASAVE